jgi:hypothetical protein
MSPYVFLTDVFLGAIQTCHPVLQNASQQTSMFKVLDMIW